MSFGEICKNCELEDEKLDESEKIELFTMCHLSADQGEVICYDICDDKYHLPCVGVISSDSSVIKN